jgi:methyl-accepting chemotaxis protein
VQKATEDAVAAIGGIGRTIGQVSTIASAIATSVDQQRAATQEIAHNVQEVARSSGVANTSMTAVSGSAGQTGEAARAVTAGVGALADEADRLGVQVDRFLGKIRRTG